MTIQQVKQEKTIIRPLETRDIEAIFDIDRMMTGEERAVTLTNLVTEDLGGALDLSFVAENNGQVVGFVLARHAYIGEPVVDAGLIQGLGVNPLYQRQGIGRHLVAALTERSLSKGIKTLRVMLREYDSRMEGFFSKIDFHRTQLIVYDRKLSK